jgi:hypothetical protein
MGFSFLVLPGTRQPFRLHRNLEGKRVSDDFSRRKHCHQIGAHEESPPGVFRVHPEGNSLVVLKILEPLPSCPTKFADKPLTSHWHESHPFLQIAAVLVILRGASWILAAAWPGPASYGMMRNNQRRFK